MNNTEPSTFKITERFYCQWTNGGAKEYFNTLVEAINHARLKYQRGDKMTDQSFAYWQNQQFNIGKEAVIVQHLSIVSNNLPVS